MQGSDHAEVLRLRDRLHELSSSVTRNGWRLDALDEWRKQVDVRLVRAEDELSKMTTADKIADAVASRMKERSGVEFTVIQKAGAALIAAFAFASSLHAWGVF